MVQLHNSTVLILAGLISGFITPFQAIGINIVGIKHTLNDGYKRGLMMGLGSSLIQLIFAIIGLILIFSPKGISDHLDSAISIAGIALLGWFGYKIYSEKIPESINNHQKITTQRDYFHSLLLGISLAVIKPGRIILYTLLFACFDIHYTSTEFLMMWPLFSGVFIGSIIWWAMFVSVITRLRHRIINKVSIFNKVGGAILILLSLIELLLLVINR